MSLIEQAVFTSARTDRSAGYQLAGRSPGVCEADARELVTWCPSHDSLLEAGPDAASFNFHPLPSGAYCASRSVPAGAEQSRRGGARVYTQCLIVPPDVLARFANNPFALFRAALANGSLRVFDEVPERLEPLSVAGRAAAVDAALLARLAANPGVPWLATLVRAALDSFPLGLTGGPPAVHLIAGLINCLPPECRTEFSFTTGLKFSPHRPFRVVVLPGDAVQQHRLRRRYNMAILDFNGDPPTEFAPNDGWARLIRRVLQTGRTTFLATQFSKRRFELAPKDLPALGLQLLEELDASTLRETWVDEDAPVSPVVDGPAAPEPEGDAAQTAPWDQPVPGTAPGPETPLTRAHAAHRRFAKTGQPTRLADSDSEAPSKLLGPDTPEVLERLEMLDDVVFEAVSGSTTCLEQLEVLWPAVRAELGDALVAESREQYLRYALSIWEECLEPEGIRNPARAAAALDVLCILFDE
jgi:hypothetical protein